MEKENKELITINFQNPDVIKTLKETVARGASDSEFMMFAEICKASGLNPFKREIWFIKTGDRCQMMTGINGYLAIANSRPEFDGMEVETRCENGRLSECVCKVWRKDRSYPAIGIARWKEDGKDYGVWKEKPTLMLEKVAKSRALREAFPQQMSGLYTQEEMDEIYSIEAPVRVANKTEQRKREEKKQQQCAAADDEVEVVSERMKEQQAVASTQAVSIAEARTFKFAYAIGASDLAPDLKYKAFLHGAEKGGVIASGGEVDGVVLSNKEIKKLKRFEVTI